MPFFFIGFPHKDNDFDDLISEFIWVSPNTAK